MNIIKTLCLVAGGLLLFATLDLPYGYYQFLRIAISFISILCILTEIEKENSTMILVFGSIVILFNPIIPIHFNKGIWTPIDVITSLLFILSGAINKQKQ